MYYEILSRDTRSGIMTIHNSTVDGQLRELKSCWSSEDVETMPAADEREVECFERDHGVVLPDDLRAYFKTINGMIRNTVDNLFMNFLPLSAVRSVPAQLGDYGGIPDYRGIVDTLPDVNQWFVLVDYFSTSHVYSIRLSSQVSDSNHVIVICGSSFAFVAQSWSEFLTVYLQNDTKRLFPGN